MSWLRLARSRGPMAGCAFCLCLGLVPKQARADEPTRVADDFFQSGAAAYQRGEYTAAALAFDEAERRAPRAETSYNAGVAWEAAGQPLRALNALHTALTLGALAERLQADALARQTRLAGGFAKLELRGPNTATLEISGVLREHLPVETYVEPGTYALTVEYATGARETRSLSVAAADSRALTFREPVEPAPTVPHEPAKREQHARSWPLVLGVVSLGIAGVSAGTGIALGARGLSARNRFDQSQHTDAEARDQAVHLRTYADLAFGGALAFSALGVVLLLERPQNDSGAASLTFGPGSLLLARGF